jgi:hypothetical protein
VIVIALSAFLPSGAGVAAGSCWFGKLVAYRRLLLLRAKRLLEFVATFSYEVFEKDARQNLRGRG